MKNIRNFSGFIFVLVIIITSIFYFINLTQINKNVSFYIPAVTFLFTVILLSFILFLNKKISKLKEEINLQSKTDYIYDDTVDDASQHEVKAESLINYTAIIERVAGRIKNGESEVYFESLLASLSKELNGVQAIIYLVDKNNDEFVLAGKYAYYSENEVKTIKIGEGISGQVAKDKKMLIMDSIPNGYIQVLSGLGKSTPKYLLLYPVILEEKTIALIEIAAFEEFINNVELVFDKLTEKILPEILKFIK